MQGSAVGQGIIKRKRIKLNNLSQCLSLSGRYDIPAQHNSLVVLGRWGVVRVTDGDTDGSSSHSAHPVTPHVPGKNRSILIE